MHAVTCYGLQYAQPAQHMPASPARQGRACKGLSYFLKRHRLTTSTLDVMSSSLSGAVRAQK